ARPWMEALRPVRAQLVAPLSAIFRDTKSWEKERSVATAILADYAADQPAVLADLILDADAQQYAVLRPVLQAHREDAISFMEEELKKQLSPDWKDGPLNSAWTDPDPLLVRQLDAAHGMLDKHFALCQTMPLNQFVTTAEGLRRSGYRPIRFRPYAVGKVVQ